MRIGLVGCVKSKLDHAAPAAALYTSPLFTGARHAVEESCDCWFVLSALYGLVPPDRVLEPYEKTLSKASLSERRSWAARALQELTAEFGTSMGGLTFEIHAGSAYEGFGLSDGLRQLGAKVERPLSGLGLGKRLRWYKQRGYL
jgi:hypothetical protein